MYVCLAAANWVWICLSSVIDDPIQNIWILLQARWVYINDCMSYTDIYSSPWILCSTHSFWYHILNSPPKSMVSTSACKVSILLVIIAVLSYRWLIIHIPMIFVVLSSFYVFIVQYVYILTNRGERIHLYVISYLVVRKPAVNLLFIPTSGNWPQYKFIITWDLCGLICSCFRSIKVSSY